MRPLPCGTPPALRRRVSSPASRRACPYLSTNGRNPTAGSVFCFTHECVASTRCTLKPSLAPLWFTKIWNDRTRRRSKVEPSPGAVGNPLMPSRARGSSSAHGMLRTSTQISPAARGCSATIPPGVCPCTVTPFTLRFTTTDLSVVLLTATAMRANRERSYSPPAKSMRTPGQRYSVPVFTSMDPSGSGAIAESGCA